MNWDDLRCVLAVARKRTLASAAASLGVTHTTVGRRLRAIEEQMGVRMFDRTPDGFVPTSSGRDLVEVAERMESEVLSLEGRVLGRDAQLEGSLRVSTLDILYLHFFDVFAAFTTRYPSVELSVSASQEQVSLTRREADVALRLANEPPENLVGRRLGRVEFAVYGNRELVEAAGPEASYADFPWIHWDLRTHPRWLDQWLAEHAPGARVGLRIDNMVVLRQSVAAGLGVHFLPCFDGDADPMLTRIGPVVPELDRDLWLLTLPELRSTQRIQAFMSHVEESLRGCARLGASRQPDES